VNKRAETFDQSATRSKEKQRSEKLIRAYDQLLNSTSRVVGQAKRFSAEIAAGLKRSTNPLVQLKLEGLRQTLEEMMPRVKQVMKQTKAHIHGGDTRSEGKLLSVFEPSTEIIRKGKSGKPNEFGKMVKLQEAENQIAIEFEVHDPRPSDSDLPVPAIDAHQAALGRTPYLLAADAAFYSRKNEAAARSKGAKRICVPHRSPRVPNADASKRSAGSATASISVTKRRHGLSRCRYKGESGMKRWVGLGVISDNLINIGRAMPKQSP
jgi:transposase, IS5 family